MHGINSTPPPHSKVEDGSGKQFSSLTPTSAIDLPYQLAEMPSKNENERIKIWKVRIHSFNLLKLGMNSKKIRKKIEYMNTVQYKQC